VGLKLLDRFTDDRLLEMFALFDQAQLQLVDIVNPAAVDTLLWPLFPQI